jgi:hypothetical protein
MFLQKQNIGPVGLVATAHGHVLQFANVQVTAVELYRNNNFVKSVDIIHINSLPFDHCEDHIFHCVFDPIYNILY